MKISNFTQTILASLLLSVILMQIFITGLQRKLGSFFYEELVTSALYISLIPAIALVGILLVIDIFYPFYLQLRSLDPKPIDASRVVENYGDLCEKFQLESTPSIFVADVSIPFSLGVHKGKSMIIIPEFLLNFTQEERESVIAHELWHIKTDAEASYLWLFEAVSTALIAFIPKSLSHMRHE